MAISRAREPQEEVLVARATTTVASALLVRRRRRDTWSLPKAVLSKELLDEKR